MLPFIRFITVSGACLTALSAVFFFMEQEARDRTVSEGAAPLIASAGTTYFGPKSPVVGNPQLVRIEVVLKDSADSSGPQLVSVTFYNKNIPLKPRDVYGNRGSASFQVPPGKYKLNWTVNRDRYVWPRRVEHEMVVTVSPRDLWLQLEVQGDQATLH